MSELPEDRLEPAPPFTYCAVDCFGPWTIKEGRCERKRYGVLYTCMTSRAVHIEIANSLSTDSFINSLRRFIAIRGPVRQLRSDNGTNFVGAKRELSELIHKINHDHVRQYLLENGCDFVFKMNIPAASHMGGVWERQIRSVRAVLSTLMMQSGTQLDDESLRTFMYEAAAIVNSRPLTVDTLNDVTSLAPLTPNHLLTMKTKIILPPPGEFQKEDVYSKKRWRRVQYMANEFWTRWKREFLQNQQVRSKWNDSKREICNGDIVLLIDDSLPRNQWSVCRVVETYPDADNHVRKVKLYIGNKYLNSDGKCVIPPVYLERPVQKLVLLLGLEDQGNPRQGAN
ncbi:uncharacterized protein LOC130014010 [Patella vulgata]|uniref:uncharacterized protein LOC130014010 n=1 Tax=Patella vulgata TaxID=6465 RepID=UPI0024A90451|nr:uncharacterized protein LOC130014010 [Patella vulgata]